jgi:hypothetical protein
VGDSASLLYAVARFAGSALTSVLILGLAPQALCCRPLRGLSAHTNIFAVDAHPTTPLPTLLGQPDHQNEPLIPIKLHSGNKLLQHCVSLGSGKSIPFE